MTPPLQPLTEPYTEDVTALLNRYPTIDGYLLTLFRTFANSRRFLEKGIPNLLDGESPLPLRAREIVILRITANNNCEYEWGVHVSVFAKAAGFTDEQIASTRNKTLPGGLWAPKEAHLIKAIDQLCCSGMIDGSVRAHFESDWSPEQQLEILALCGAYHTISFVANVADLENEPFGATFPNRNG